MSFLEIFGYDIFTGLFGLASDVCVGIVILKNMPRGSRRKYAFCKVFLPLVYVVTLAFLMAFLYKGHLLRLTAVNIAASYMVLLGNAACISMLFGEAFQTCWGIVIFSGIAKEFSGAVCFSLLSDRPLDLSIPNERMLYLFGNTLMSPALFLLFLFFLYKMKIGKVYCQWMEHKSSWGFGLICLSTYPLLYIGGAEFLMGWGMSRNGSLIFVFLIMFVMLALFNYMGLEEQQRKEFDAQQLILKQQNAYIHTLEGMQEEMRRFRHDYKNMMSGMYLKAKEGDLTEALEFIREMTEDFDSQIGGQLRQMSQLGNVYMSEIKGLLLTKLSEMQKDQTACEVEVMHPFYGAEFKTTDLCRCLGILIDNAMDEVRGREDARVYIMISSQEDCTTFRVKNLLYHKVDVPEIWKQGYSTRGTDRGTGLASYKKTVDLYENVLPVTAVKDGYFIQELKIRKRNAE